MFVVLFEIKLTDLYPKVAHWHKTCRQENEILKRNYEQYVELLG